MLLTSYTIISGDGFTTEEFYNLIVAHLLKFQKTIILTPGNSVLLYSFKYKSMIIKLMKYLNFARYPLYNTRDMSIIILYFVKNFYPVITFIVEYK
jgi:hypothetical protein